MNIEKKIKWFVGSVIVAAVTLFAVLVMNSNGYGHGPSYQDHQYMGHHGNYWQYGGHNCHMPDEYRDLLEKQRKEREIFLKEQEVKKQLKGGNVK